MEDDRQYIPYFDFVRGLAIFFVVFNHSYSGDPLAGSLTSEIYLVLREAVTCAVPLFLAESGFFLAPKKLLNWRQYKDFVCSHSFRIWLPMVIWSLPLFIINDHQNYLLSAGLMIMGGYSIYYFITLIIQYYILQPLLVKVDRVWVAFCFIITCISTAIVCYLMAIKGVRLPLIVAVGSFPVWLVYPALGYYIRKRGRDYKLWPWVVLLILGLVACFFESKILYPPYKEGLGATKISAVIYSCATILVLFNNRVQTALTSKLMAYRAFLYLGKISFGMYLIHKYFLDYLVGPVVNDTLIRTIFVIALSTAFITLFRRIAPKFAKKYLGFK